jgi:hypothetical protein
MMRPICSRSRAPRPYPSLLRTAWKRACSSPARSSPWMRADINRHGGHAARWRRKNTRVCISGSCSQVGTERTGLSAFELSLKQQNLDIEKSRPETSAANSSDDGGIPEKCASETLQRPANLRKYRGDFCVPGMPQRDGTGPLGRQDSNLGMAESKSAALPLGYAPSRRVSVCSDARGRRARGP